MVGPSGGDHGTMEMEVDGEAEGDTREEHKVSSRNYEETNFVELKIFLVK